MIKGPDGNERPSPRSRCLRCGMPQYLEVQDDGPVAKCPACGYKEELRPPRRRAPKGDK